MPWLGCAHLLGGALFGAGMGISGLCPGTCVAKAGGRGGDRKFATPAAIVGLVAGVLIYGAAKDWLLATGVIAANQKPLTIYGELGLPYAAAALAWGAIFVLIALFADRFTPEKTYEPARPRHGLLDAVRGEWSWVASGTVGGVLVVLATAQNGYLGFSGALLAATGWAAQAVGHPLELVPRINEDIAWRAALIVGVWPGAWLASRLSLPSKAAVADPAPKVFDPVAIGRSFGAGHHDGRGRADRRRLHHRRLHRRLADHVAGEPGHGRHLLPGLDGGRQRPPPGPHPRRRRRPGGGRSRL